MKRGSRDPTRRCWACEHLGEKTYDKPLPIRTGRAVTKAKRDHGVGDAGMSIIRQSKLVFAKNGCRGTRLVDALSSIRACSVQYPFKFCVTILGDNNSLSEQLQVWKPAEE